MQYLHETEEEEEEEEVSEWMTYVLNKIWHFSSETLQAYSY